MPTVGTKPSLRCTQAVGAILLHQFARERFLQAGIDANLIREAENFEHVDDLTTELLDDDHNKSNQNVQAENDEQVLSQNTSGQAPDTGLNSTSNTDDGNYHSIIADQSTTSSLNGNATMYHSLISNNANNSATKNCSLSPIDRIQSSSPTLASYGQELRRIAEEFERTRLRATVRERAEQVNISDIKRENFVQLMEELFQEKITREKIVILFFFCTDVALRAAQLAHELVVKLLGWSFSYIIDRVCQYVYKLGGWDRVLFHQLPSVLMSCCAALAMFSLFVYLRKSLRS